MPWVLVIHALLVSQFLNPNKTRIKSSVLLWQVFCESAKLGPRPHIDSASGSRSSLLMVMLTHNILNNLMCLDLDPDHP